MLHALMPHSLIQRYRCDTKPNKVSKLPKLGGRQQYGFTLLEILIAMAIFTLIGLASTGLLMAAIDSNDLSATRLEKLQQLQRAMLTIERDIQQAVERPVRINGEVNEITFYGEDEEDVGVALVRNGWSNPQMRLPRSTLQLVSYRLQDQQLQRLSTNYVDNVSGTEPKVRILLDNIERFDVEFLEGIAGNGDLDWAETYKGTVLPKAVSVTLVSVEFGEITRVFTLSGAQI